MSEQDWAQGVRDALLRAFHNYDEEGGPLSPLVVEALAEAGARIVPVEPTKAMVDQMVEMHMPFGEMVAAWDGALAAAPSVVPKDGA